MLAEPTTQSNVARMEPRKIKWQDAPWELSLLPLIPVVIAGTNRTSYILQIVPQECWWYRVYLASGESFGMNETELDMDFPEWRQLL